MIGGSVTVLETESVGVVMESVGVPEPVGVMIGGRSVIVPLITGTDVVIGREIGGRVTIAEPLVVDGSKRLDKIPPRPLEVVVGEGTSVTIVDPAVPGPVTPAVVVGLRPSRSDDKRLVVPGFSLVAVSVVSSDVYVVVGSIAVEVGVGVKRGDKNVPRPGSRPSSVEVSVLVLSSVGSTMVRVVTIPPGPNVTALSVSGNNVVAGLVDGSVVVGLTIIAGISPVEPSRGFKTSEMSRPGSLLVGRAVFESFGVVSGTNLVVGTSSGELVGSNGETTPSNRPPVVPAEDGEESPVVNPFRKSVNERFVEKEVKGSCLLFSGATVVFENNWRFTCLGK